MFKHLQTKFLALLAIMLMGGGSVWAEEESFTFSNYTNQQEVVNVEGTNVTIEFNKGTNSNAPKYYTSGTAVRVYGGNYFVITSNYSITKIELTFGSSDGSNAITTDVGTYSDGTWTGSAKSIKFTIGGTSGNRRISAIKVTYTTGIGEKEDAVIDVEDANVAYGSSYTIDSSMIEGGDITVTSSNTSVATVDGLVITPVAVGSTTITVATAENEVYKAGSENFTLTVTAPEGKTTAPATEDEVIFYESFAGSTGYTTNENDNFSGQAGNGTLQADNDGWEFTNEHGAGESAKFGASKNAGSATTPSITVENGKEYTLTFKAAPWASDESTMNITVAGGNISGVSSANMTTGQWNDYEATITATSAALTITFEASNNRFFLDEVKITAPAEAADAPTLTLSASGYASYCCEYPLDFTSIDRNTFKAWYVSDVNGSDVTFSEITGSIKGGEAFFLYGNTGAVCQLAYAESSSEVLDGNKLVGTLAPTYVENGNGIQNYGLKGGNFVKMGNGVVIANKSYLPVEVGEVGTETPARLNIIFESQEATGIMNVSRESTTDKRYYNLNGQRVMNPTKGMYIVNGKKVIIK